MSTEPHDAARAAPAAPTRPPQAGGNAPAPRQWTSVALLGPAGEAFIEHADALYRLRVTSTGKLILTK